MKLTRARKAVLAASVLTSLTLWVGGAALTARKRSGAAQNGPVAVRVVDAQALQTTGAPSRLDRTAPSLASKREITNLNSTPMQHPQPKRGGGSFGVL